MLILELQQFITGYWMSPLALKAPFFEQDLSGSFLYHSPSNFRSRTAISCS